MANNKVFIGIVAGIVVFIFLIVVYMATNNSTVTTFAEANKVVSSDHVNWSKSKKHILTEYADLQCPACGMFHQYLKDNVENDKTITTNVTFVFRNFPLITVHKHAQEAAYAAEAADKQGKYFEYADLVFSSQKEWEGLGKVDDYFLNLAKKLKLDTEKFKADKDSKAVKDKVASDVGSATRLNVNSTPTFYLDGVKVDVTSLADFKKLILDTAKKPSPSSTPSQK